MNACTLWFDRLLWWNWHDCCVAHDLGYLDHIGKAIADAQLEHCVDGVLPGMGIIMWLGVTVFGGIWYWNKRRLQRL